MLITDCLVIPVTDELRITAEEVERHCANSGWIVTNVRPAPDDMSVRAANTTMKNGDYGMNFWIADVVACELENHYDDTPAIELPFDFRYSAHMQEVEKFFHQMFENKDDDE